jgi:UDP-N-acetylmuramate-alanine ligase
LNKEEYLYLNSFDGAKKIISNHITNKSILIVMGAGSISKFAKEIIGLVN